jgi:hypothetical protein
MSKIEFSVASCPETGGYIARWDDPAGGGIVTQGDNFGELDVMVRDAVLGYFFDKPLPDRIGLHFIEDPELAVV